MNTLFTTFLTSLLFYCAVSQMAEERSRQGVILARRQAMVTSILQRLSLLNDRTAKVLAKLHIVRKEYLPENLPSEPLMVEAIVDRFKRYAARQAELAGMEHAELGLDEIFRGREKKGEVLAGVPISGIKRMVQDTTMRIRRAPTLRLATLLEAQGKLQAAIRLRESQFEREHRVRPDCSVFKLIGLIVTSLYECRITRLAWAPIASYSFRPRLTREVMVGPSSMDSFWTIGRITGALRSS